MRTKKLFLWIGGVLLVSIGGLVMAHTLSQYTTPKANTAPLEILTPDTLTQEITSPKTIAAQLQSDEDFERAMWQAMVAAEQSMLASPHTTTQNDSDGSTSALSDAREDIDAKWNDGRGQQDEKRNEAYMTLKDQEATADESAPHTAAKLIKKTEKGVKQFRNDIDAETDTFRQGIDALLAEATTDILRQKSFEALQKKHQSIFESICHIYEQGLAKERGIDIQ